MKTLATIAVTVCCLFATTASAQNRVQIAPIPGVAPIQPQVSYFLGVYTRTVQLPPTGPVVGPVGPLAVQVQPRVVPLPGPAPQIYGQQVTQVVPGSPAARVGLEPGDILVTGNRIPLTCRQRLTQAIGQSRGYLQLGVINVRTGQLVHLTAYPDPQGGPVFMTRR